MKDGTGTSRYGYDQLDRLTESESGHKELVKYEYDLANEQAKLVYPGGKAVSRVFDKDGRLEKVTDWLEHSTTFAYDPDSELASSTFPTGTGDVDTYAYNDADQMSEVKMAKGAETLASLAYTRDGDGQVKGITSKGLPGEKKPAEEYDSNNRLVKGAGTAYEYDAANNPTRLGSGGYGYDSADELETGPSVSYAYDEMGQRVKATPATGPVTSYGYDQAGNLISVERPKEGTMAKIEDAYAYDGHGLRASQSISGATSYLAWDASGSLPLLLADGTNSYIYGPGGLPVEQINNTTGTVQYLHHDQAGSTRLLTGSTGKTEATFTYGPYGETTGHTGTATTPLGYDGQYTSSDTGLIYMRARTYDPSTAQFLSRDPLEMQTQEPYSYAADNPLNAADRTGRELELPEIEAPCWWPFCGPPPPAVEGVKEIGEGVIEGAETTWHEIENGWSEIAGNGGCSPASDGEALRREGEQLLGRKHGEAARERWREWWSKLGNAEKKAYNKAKGPKPRKGG
jgi:RHS repeat-associated protein